MLTLIAFVVALGLLITVHEYGHYRVAVACGVKVLRFSVGFGKPLLRWQRKGSPTEFVLCALPLGGYVRMLDEREAPVDAAERHLAFNTQPLKSRAAIVAAGPAANLLLAVVLYAVVNWSGVDEPKPVLAAPVAGSLAQQAGLQGGEWVSQVGAGADSEPVAVLSFEDLRWRLTQAALSGEDMTLWVAREEGDPARAITLPLSTLDVREADASLFRRIGILAPWTAPQLGDLLPDGAGEAAGLRAGDLVLQVDGRPVADGQSLRTLIREAVGPQGEPRVQQWLLQRGAERLTLPVQPKPEQHEGVWVGRIGAYVGAAPAMTRRCVSRVRWTGCRRGRRAHLGGFLAHAQDDGAHGDRRGLDQEPQRTSDDRRLRGQVGQPGPDVLSAFSGADQRQPGGAQPAATAGPRWRAPDVLSLGGCDRTLCVRRLDGAPAARWCCDTSGVDVRRLVQ